MVILRPRTLLSSALAERQQIAAAIVDRAGGLAVGGEQPIAAIMVWLLPEPDSPTTATVSPALT